MLWLVCFSLFTLTSSFPFGNILGRNEFKNYQVQVIENKGLPHQRHSICLPSPFLRRICLPTALQFFIPLQTLETGHQRCLTIPVMTTHTIKICPSSKAVSEKENFNESFKEVVTEEEKERLPDSTNIEVNGEEVISEDFVKEESEEGRRGTEESQAEDKNTKNNIIRDLNETDVEENESLERLLTDKNFEEENISITSNLVR